MLRHDFLNEFPERNQDAQLAGAHGLAVTGHKVFPRKPDNRVPLKGDVGTDNAGVGLLVSP